MDEDLSAVLKQLGINGDKSPHGRILKVLWPMEWVTIPEIISKNKNQSDSPRRIRELRNEFGFDIPQNGSGEHSSYRLESREHYEKKRRAYLNTTERRTLVRRDGIKCNICGRVFDETKGNLQFDHRIPFDKEGPTTVENSQLLCVQCNVIKKRICEHCTRESCDDCAYAYPEKSSNMFILDLPEQLKDKCEKIGEDAGMEVEDVVLKAVESFQYTTK